MKQNKIKRAIWKRWWFMTALFLFVILPIIASSVLYFSVQSFSKSAISSAESMTPFDVAIVPGVPFEGEKWSDIMRMRVSWAKHLYDEGKVKHLIFSGGAVYTPYIEGEIMANYARALAIPDSVIFVESRAEHSTENIYSSLQIANSLGFENIVLTSDVFQTFFLSKFKDIHKGEISYYPFMMGDGKVFEFGTPEIDPGNCKVDNFVALPEREDFFTRMDGTLGKHIEELYNEEID